VTSVPNGVSTDVFVPGAPRTRDGGPLRLLFVGRLSDERKGLRYMLEAYEQLRAQGVAVTLDIVGEQAGAPVPPAMPGLTYHGPVPRSELIKRFQECDVYVAPSTGQESFGIVLLEAMATGAPIVCSDIEGYRAVASPTGSVLVPPRDAQALAAAITSLVNAPERRARMGAVNLEHVRAYDWSTVATRVREEYLVAIENRAARYGVRTPLLAPAPSLPALSASASLPRLAAPPSVVARVALSALSEAPPP
jgi:phosphatidylinositol alpha-mannosyltransferase